jgi:hypothetical protein
MKKHLIMMTAVGLLFSCNSADPTKISNDTTLLKQPHDATASEFKRQRLIDELERLQIVFASKEKARIADIFQFPLSDTMIDVYIADSLFNEQFRSNGGMITRAMFVRSFPQISESLQIDELNQLFTIIDVQSLLKKDTAEREVWIKTDPCTKFYGIEIVDNIVTLRTGQGVNRSFVTSPTSEDDVSKNSSEFCEHVLWWVFRFDGKHLHFIKQHGAG